MTAPAEHAPAPPGSRQAHREASERDKRARRFLLRLSLANWAIAVVAWTVSAFLGITSPASIIVYSVLFVIGLIAVIMALLTYLLEKFAHRPPDYEHANLEGDGDETKPAAKGAVAAGAVATPAPAAPTPKGDPAAGTDASKAAASPAAAKDATPPAAKDGAPAEKDAAPAKADAPPAGDVAPASPPKAEAAAAAAKADAPTKADAPVAPTRDAAPAAAAADSKAAPAKDDAPAAPTEGEGKPAQGGAPAPPAD